MLVPVVTPARGFYSIGVQEGLRYQGHDIVIDGRVWQPANGPWCSFLAGAIEARGNYGQAVARARAVTKAAEQPVGIGYIRGWDTGALGIRYLVQLHGVCRLVDQLALMKAAEIIEKVVLNPLTVKGFDRIVNILTARLRTDIAKVTKSDVTAMLNALDVNWRTGTVSKIREAEKVIRTRMASAGKKAGAQTPKTLKPSGDRTVRVTRRETIKKWDLGIEVATQVKDLDAIRKVAQAQSNFVTDFYTKQLNPALSATARTVVQDGMRQGLTNRAITADLRKAMAGQLAGRTASYYKVVTSQFTNRARSWSQLNAFSDADLDRYIISAVLDEATTDTCFAAGTLVRGADGDVPIESILPGDVVISGSGRRAVEATTTRFTDDWLLVRLSFGRHLTVTGNHPILTERGWTAARDIGVGDQVVQAAETNDARPGRDDLPRVRAGVRAQRASEVEVPIRSAAEVLLQPVLPPVAERTRRDDVPALRPEVRDLQEVSPTRAVQVLRHGLSEGCAQKGSQRFGTKARLPDLWQGVPHQAERGVGSQSSAPLLEEVLPETKPNALRLVRDGIRVQDGVQELKALLLPGMLSEVIASQSARTAGGVRAEATGHPLRIGTPSGRLRGGLRPSRSPRRGGSGRGLLARQGGALGDPPQERRNDSSGGLDVGASAASQGRAPSRDRDPGEYFARNPRRAVVVEVRRLDLFAPAYNLQVADDPTYFAEGVLVHNCRALDGKTLNTKTGIAHQEAVNDLNDPLDVKTEQPWFIERKIGSGPDEGKKGLYLPNKKGGPTLAGVVEKSGFGRQDDKGKTNWKMSDSALQARGVGSPPYHGHCRTTIIPDI